MVDFYKGGPHLQVLLNTLNPQFRGNPFGSFEFFIHNDERTDRHNHYQALCTL